MGLPLNQINPWAWTNAALDLWLLGAEAASVVSLRIVRVAAGGSSAATEVELMVREKALAAAELQARYLSGGVSIYPLAATQTFLDIYRSKVAANSHRLQQRG